MNQQLETLRSVVLVHTILHEASLPVSRHGQLIQAISWLEAFHKELAKAIVANPPADISESDLALLQEVCRES